MYVYVNHFAVHLKLKQWCKSTILQLKKTQSSRVCFPWTRTGPGGWSFKEWAHSGAFPAGDSTTSSVQAGSEPIRCRGWRLTITWRVITFCCCRCSVAQSCPTLCNPIDCSMPGFPVHHHLTISRSLHKLMSIELVMPSNHLILCHPLLLLPSIYPSIRVFSNESALRMRWPKYWSFSFSISPSNEYSGLISFRIDWFVSLQSKRLLRVLSNTTVQKHWFFGTQLSLVHLSHPYMTIGKTAALTRRILKFTLGRLFLEAILFNILKNK